MTDTNRDLALRWFREVWNERRNETIDELFAAHSVGHMEGGDGTIADFKSARAGLLEAFPDFSVEVEDTVAERDHVVVRWVATGTHPGRGLGIEATGRPVTFRGMTWLKFQDGKAVEGWDSWNLGGLLTTLRSEQSSSASSTSG
ncbi:MAG: ester cyclase [Acidobacteria bacterium]|nr:ester cyclase [Acidobacteriota bacterium]